MHFAGGAPAEIAQLNAVEEAMSFALVRRTVSGASSK
jgi:hypothetical protein